MREPQFKVVYAYAADRPNRFAGWKDALQANVAIIQRFLSAQDGGTKGIRFDMGTGCGPQYVDIQGCSCQGPALAYEDNFGAISGAVRRALVAAGGPRNAVVLADGLSGGSAGVRPGRDDHGCDRRGPGAGERPQPRRPHLRALQPGRRRRPGRTRWGWWPEGFLHEMTHNLGAVQWGAPHSTEPRGRQLAAIRPLLAGRRRHVLRRGRRRRAPMQRDCAGLPGAIPQNYDCGRDDYFNPAPAADSYLATHWNTYDSAFLAPCGEIAPACGGGSAVGAAAAGRDQRARRSPAPRAAGRSSPPARRLEQRPTGYGTSGSA